MSRAIFEEVRLRSGSRVERARKTVFRLAKRSLDVVLASVLLVVLAPLGALVARSFAAENGLTLDFYRFLLYNPRESAFYVPPGAAALNSLGFALGTVALATTLGLMAVAVLGNQKRLSRWLDPVFMLPLGTSAVIVGFGFLVSLDTPPLDLRTSVLLIPIAHSLIALPFVMRALVPLVRSIDDRLREAAAVLGASPRRAWREVDGPILARGALVGAGFAFAVSLGEFGATLFIARPDSVTVPVASKRASTLCWRWRAASGERSGLSRVGAWGKPASSVASARLRWRLGLPKRRRLAASTPIVPAP